MLVSKDKVIEHSEYGRVNVIEVLCKSSEDRSQRGARTGRGSWAWTWVGDPVEDWKAAKKVCYIWHGKDTKSKDTEKGSGDMCLNPIEGTFIVALGNKRRCRKGPDL